jgi:hypothetical protein
VWDRKNYHRTAGCGQKILWIFVRKNSQKQYGYDGQFGGSFEID